MTKKLYWDCEVIELGDRDEIVVKGNKLPKETIASEYDAKAEVIAFNYDYRTNEYLDPNPDDEFKAYLVTSEEYEIPNDFIKVAEFSNTVEIFTGNDVKRLDFLGCKIQFLRRGKRSLIIKVEKISTITEKEREAIKELGYNIEGKPITKNEILEKVENCLTETVYNKIELVEKDLNTAKRDYKLYISIDNIDSPLSAEAEKWEDSYRLTSRIY